MLLTMMKVGDDHAENYQERNQMQKMRRSHRKQTVHDFKFCSCGSCAVDGGHDYLRRCGNREDWEELSEVEKVEDNGALT